MRNIISKINNRKINDRLQRAKVYNNPLIPQNAIITNTENVQLMRIVSGAKNSHTVDSPDIDYKVAANAYKNYWLLRRALGVRASNVAPRIVRVMDTNPRNRRRVILNHPLTRAFNNPNPSMGNVLFNMSYEIDMVLAGEWFVEIKELRDGTIELWHRRPDEIVQIETKQRGVGDGLENRPVVSAYYVQCKNGGSTKPIKVEPENMIHIRSLNPTNIFRGTGDVQAILSLIYSDSTIQQWMNQLIKNNAIPSYVFVATSKIGGVGGLRADERDEIADELMRQFGGIHKSGRPLVLENDQQLKPISFRPNELQYLQLSKMNQDSISSAIGVPNELLGTGNNTYDNFSNAMRYLWTMTLLPDIQMRDEYLNAFFEQRGDLRRFQEIETDISSVTFLQEDFTTRLEQGLKLLDFGAWTPNQIAGRLQLNMPINLQGDVIYSRSNYVPVAKVEPELAVARSYFQKRLPVSNSKTVKKQLPDDVPEIVQGYENDILDLIDQVNDGELDEGEFKEALTGIVIAFVLAAFLAGSGMSRDELGDDEIEAIAEELEDALLGVDNLTVDVFAGRLGGDNESQLDTLARVGLWAGVGLSVYNHGLLFDRNDPLLMWVMDPAKDNCSTCLQYNRQVKRASEWRRLGVYPQGRMLECRGYRCGCKFVEQ